MPVSAELLSCEPSTFSFDTCFLTEPVLTSLARVTGQRAQGIPLPVSPAWDCSLAFIDIWGIQIQTFMSVLYYQ